MPEEQIPEGTFNWNQAASQIQAVGSAKLVEAGVIAAGGRGPNINASALSSFVNQEKAWATARTSWRNPRFTAEDITRSGTSIAQYFIDADAAQIERNREAREARDLRLSATGKVKRLEEAYRKARWDCQATERTFRGTRNEIVDEARKDCRKKIKQARKLRWQPALLRRLPYYHAKHAVDERGSDLS